MMLPVLSSEYFVYHCMQKLAVVRVYRRSYHASDDSKITSIILTAVDHIIGRQQCFACYGIQSTRTTAQVASFESPPCNGKTEFWVKKSHKMEATSRHCLAFETN